jgi:ribosomal protein L23
MNYIGKTSRHTKVKEKILQDLKSVYGVDPKDVEELYLKPEKRK